MHPNQARLENFHTACAQLDSDTMAGCYPVNAIFDDELFSLKGHEQVTGMWHTLCDATKARASDAWNLTCGGIEADELAGKSHGVADCRFNAGTLGKGHGAQRDRRRVCLQ